MTAPQAEGAPRLEPAEVRMLVDHLAWAGREVRGGMDAYIRVRAAAQSDAFRRVAAEVERAAAGGNEALLSLAAALRRRCLDGEVPQDVRLPAWPAQRPVPTLDPARVRREQQIGFGLGLAQSAARIHVAAGGRV
ncbi:MAG TPA: hypothetical protein VHS99_27630 [Chloroflexota bacterium]|jgi:hypothetical protein|nr:hypothetical protein [Chloroflexota bacterium]